MADETHDVTKATNKPNQNQDSASAGSMDAVLEVFKRDIDFTLAERNLRLTFEERAQQLVNATSFIRKFRGVLTGESP